MSKQTKPITVAAKAVKNQKLDLQQLQQQQLNGEEITQATGSEDDSYEFPAHESDRLHVKLVTRENDPVKKDYINREKVVKLYPVEFERMEKNGSFAEYDEVTILHDSRKSGATKTSATGTSIRKEPMEPAAGLPSLQDAQMRYQELYGEVAPADKDYQQLVELIQAKGSLTEGDEDAK